MSQTYSLKHKLLAFSSIIPLFVDRFGRSSLQFCHLEMVDEKAIYDGLMAHSRVFFYGGFDFK